MPSLQQGKPGRLLEELRLIPWWGFLVAAVVVVVLVRVFGNWYMTALRQVWGEHSIMMALIPPLAVVILWVWWVMIFYVMQDARRRRMSVLLWTLLVIIIPNALGFIVYFLLREPVPMICPKCSAEIRPEFAFCPACRHELAPTCPSCHRPVERGWTSCAFCGVKLGEGV
jgi:hypothetical protein